MLHALGRTCSVWMEFVHSFFDFQAIVRSKTGDVVPGLERVADDFTAGQYHFRSLDGVASQTKGARPCDQHSAVGGGEGTSKPLLCFPAKTHIIVKIEQIEPRDHILAMRSHLAMEILEVQS